MLHPAKLSRLIMRLLAIPTTLGLGILLSSASQTSNQNQLYQEGQTLFKRSFKVEEGFGYRLGNPETVFFERQLGPDAKSCLECHNLKGVGGAAGNRKNVWVGIDPGLERRVDRANIRNSTALWGIGAVQALAQEMTTELQQQRKQAVEQAKAIGQPVRVSLNSKGVSFGSLTAQPTGEIDTSQIEGVDRGLVIKPFHAKGTRETIRRFTIEAAWRHHGLEAPELLKRRYPLQKNWEQYDHDEDGVINEIRTEQITALSVFQALLPTPRLALPNNPREREIAVQGQKLFTANCAQCHIPSLTLTVASVTIEGGMGTPPTQLDLLKGYPETPAVLQNKQGKVEVPLYSDLKRHEMGATLREKNGQLSDDKVTGVDPSVFITAKLWGVADSAPYLHDGRAATLREAILAHGGEAQAARQTFEKASPQEQDALLTFLHSLKAPEPNPTPKSPQRQNEG